MGNALQGVSIYFIEIVQFTKKIGRGAICCVTKISTLKVTSSADPWGPSSQLVDPVGKNEEEPAPPQPPEIDKTPEHILFCKWVACRITTLIQHYIIDI